MGLSHPSTDITMKVMDQCQGKGEVSQEVRLAVHNQMVQTLFKARSNLVMSRDFMQTTSFSISSNLIHLTKIKDRHHKGTMEDLTPFLSLKTRVLSCHQASNNPLRSTSSPKSSSSLHKSLLTNL
jgi:hypothetical protein